MWGDQKTRLSKNLGNYLASFLTLLLANEDNLPGIECEQLYVNR